MRATLITVFALLVAVLPGCSSGGEENLDGAGDASSTTDQVMDATELANELKDAAPSATKVVTITEDNDPNDLLGRPNGYESAAVIYDSDGSCDAPMTDCGAVIEVFSDERSARARGEYIQTVLKDSPALGSEWDYSKGSALLRVSGKLKPSTNAIYADAFGGNEVTAASAK